jgi:hypothetical protein
MNARCFHLFVPRRSWSALTGHSVQVAKRRAPPAAEKTEKSRGAFTPRATAIVTPKRVRRSPLSRAAERVCHPITRKRENRDFKRPFSARGRVRDGPAGCQVREPSVQDRGFFGRFIGPRRPDPGRFGLSRECRPKGAVGSGSGTGWEGVHGRDQAIWSWSNDRAGARGGARADKPRWVRILAITGGCSMAAMIVKVPPADTARCRYRISA